MERAVSPVVAIVLLIGVTVAGVAGISTVAVALDERTSPSGAQTLAVSADAETQSITLSHRGGRAMDLRKWSMEIRVDGESLAHQPPIPYFAAEGFQGTPTGPFNAGADPTFDPGEDATLQLASTNDPPFEPGDRVVVTLRTDDGEAVDASVLAS